MNLRHPWLFTIAIGTTLVADAQSIMRSPVARATPPPVPSNGLYDLGDIPARFEAVEFAAQPVTTNRITIGGQTELNAALVNGNHITVDPAGSYPDGIYISGTATSKSDILIDATGATFGAGIVFDINNSTNTIQRVRINGGTFPDTSNVQFRNRTSHITLNNVRAGGIIEDDFSSSGNTGAHGSHLTFLNSTFRTTNSSASEWGVLAYLDHVIFANVDIEIEDTIVSAFRAGYFNHLLVVDSRIKSPGNRIVRLHAGAEGSDSALAGFFRNQLEGENGVAGGANLWIAPNTGQASPGGITAVEFRANRYYNQHAAINGDLVTIDADEGEGVSDVHISTNEFYSPSSALDTAGVGAPTTFTPNTFHSYEAPPAFTGGADH